MTIFHDTSAASRTGFLASLTAALGRVAMRAGMVLRNRRSVTMLRDVDDAVLDDIGLTRADVHHALSLPLTDDPSTHLSLLVRRRRNVSPPQRYGCGPF